LSASSSFLFSCCGDPLDLHSFPTRRSSDLRSVLEQMPRLAQAIAEGMGVTVGELRVLGQQGQLTSQQVIRAIQSQLATLRDEAADRKSTRLNSSHVKISYAVFCLKKKKAQR